MKPLALACCVACYVVTPITLALMGQGQPPTPPPATPPAAPDDVPPVAGAPPRLAYEFLRVDTPSKGAMAALRTYGIQGWQFGQLENYLEEYCDDLGNLHQTQKVRLILQRPILPAPTPTPLPVPPPPAAPAS